MKKRGPKPYSLHLDHIIQKAIATHQKRDQYLRVQKDIFVLKVLTGSCDFSFPNSFKHWILAGMHLLEFTVLFTHVDFQKPSKFYD